MAGLPSCAAGVPIFRALPPDGMDELGQSMRHRRFAKGELVAATGAPVAYLIVVANGRLKQVHVSAGGREQVVRLLGPGDFLGEMALFAPAVHEHTLLAAEESDCCLVPREAIQSLMRRHPDVALRLVESLAQRLAQAEQLIVDLGLRDVGQRLAVELLREAAGSTKVKMPGPWSELALRLGTTPESLSRRLKTFAEQGLIRQEGARTVVILEPEKLRRIAE
ncbi:MAG TPA: Crp/Fnr family transcriptional regulator [Symbiobacteriaceae bacterium]|nr:Crp/Fnr family transcriptional regulator [Symbiobacteriaceae bacterium]